MSDDFQAELPHPKEERSLTVNDLPAANPFRKPQQRLSKWRTITSVMFCIGTGVINVIIATRTISPPDSFVIAMTATPFVCMAICSLVICRHSLCSWAMLLLIVGVSVYDWHACEVANEFYNYTQQPYDETKARLNKGLTVEGIIVGFAVHVTWPATLLAGAIVVGWAAARRHCQ